MYLMKTEPMRRAYDKETRLVCLSCLLIFKCPFLICLRFFFAILENKGELGPISRAGLRSEPVQTNHIHDSGRYAYVRGYV